MYQLLVYVGQLLSLYSWPMWKWVVHHITGRCELLRIQYDEQPGLFRTQKTELALKSSRASACQEILTKATDKSISETILDVMKVKEIVQDKHPVFRPRFTECIGRITGYTHLIEELESLRTEKYEEGKHKQQLLDLWKTLKPDEPLEQRFSRQWGDIGFQGTDPASDFRGMGLLGLLNLIYFSQSHTGVARQTLMHSNHPKYGYSFAIVGINLTELCVRHMKSGSLKRHFYNMEHVHPTLADFNEFYCYVFVQFDKLWMLEKPNIMQFNEMRDRYEKELNKKLSKAKERLGLPSENAADVSNLIAQEC